MFEPLKPITNVDWMRVEYVRVKLLKPHGKGGGLRFRVGTQPPIRNADFDPKKRGSLPFFPGVPIMYPEDRPVIAGTENDSFVMPASMSKSIWAKTDQGRATLPDPDHHAAFTAFGFFMAPLEEVDLPGFTIRQERERIAQFWGGYRYPKGNGDMVPTMTRIGPPEIPHVELTLLDRNQRPIKVGGQEAKIYPREFFMFDDPSFYGAEDKDRELSGALGIEGLTREELDVVRELVRVRRGKGSKQESL